jgi:DNA-binding NtrC family response regulator
MQVRQLLESRRLRHENTVLRQTTADQGFAGIIGRSPVMLDVFRLVETVCRTNSTVLISGESGTGKELVARAIHALSLRSGRPFVAVNCGAMPEALLESELFGHVRGAFTGADKDKKGLIEAADGGTVFLDEIGEMTPAMQVKLLRVLQERTYRRVGGNDESPANIRIIAATNRALPKLVSEGKFREDLFYRLNVFPMQLPALRERREDIEGLVELFIRRFAVEENKKIVGLDRPAMEMLKSYNWPGNIRQLENTVFRAVVLCDGECLRAGDFPQIASQLGITVETSHPEEPIEFAARPVTTVGGQTAGGGVGSTLGVDDLVASGVKLTGMDGHLRKLEEIEHELIRLAIDKYDGHMSEVARRLGIGRSTLYRKLREMGIDDQQAGAA